MAVVLAGMTGDRGGLAALPKVDLSLLATTDQLAATGLDMAAVREQLAERYGGAPALDPPDVPGPVAGDRGDRGDPDARGGAGAGSPTTVAVPKTFDHNGSAGPPFTCRADGTGPGSPTLSGVGAVGRLLFGYLTCNAALTRILLDDLGRPLDVGRTQRLATDAQRRALAVRDGGCGWPTCAVPFEGTAIHHLPEWQHGGPTDLLNLAAFCERHHQMLHMGLGEAKVIDGHVHVRLPRWMDPEHRWLRNTAHRAGDIATGLGQQLALLLDDDRRATARIDRPEFDPHCWDGGP